MGPDKLSMNNQVNNQDNPQKRNTHKQVDIEDVCRKIKRAADMEALQEKDFSCLSPEDIDKVCATLNRIGMSGTLARMKEGDIIVSVMNPAQRFLNIKYLNDKAFGPIVTDKIIEKRRSTLLEKLREELGDKYDKEFILEQNYKADVFRFSPDFFQENEINEIINRCCEYLNTKMEEILIEILEDSFAPADLEKLTGRIDEELAVYSEQDEEIAEIEKRSRIALKIINEMNHIPSVNDFPEDSRNNIQDKGKVLEDFGKDLVREGFRPSYGITILKGESIQDKIEALSNVTSAAIVGSIENKGTSFGTKFSDEMVERHLENIRDIREKLELKGVITDDQPNGDINEDDKEEERGRKFEIFFEQGEMNANLLRLVRKGVFHPFKRNEKNNKDRETLILVDKYIKMLNVMDFLRPFLRDEIEEFDEKHLQIVELSNKIRKNKEGFTEDEKKGLFDLLLANEKHAGFTSDEAFHFEAIKIDNCTYLTIDALDAGVIQLLDYEKLIRESITNNGVDVDVFKENAKKAGDLVTSQMREIREKIFKIVSGFNNGALLKKGKVVGRFGGDEFYIAIDHSLINDQELHELMMSLKMETGTRICKTAISSTDRDSSMENEDNKIKEHVLCLQESENGSDRIKSIEFDIHNIMTNLTHKFPRLEMELISKLFEKIVSSYDLDTIIIVNDSIGGDFKFLIGGKNGSQIRELDFNDIKVILNKVKKESEDALGGIKNGNL